MAAVSVDASHWHPSPWACQWHQHASGRARLAMDAMDQLDSGSN
eukprot:SAG22_NODE_20438_length_265_cov_1.861446_1_plen_43_part_10